MILCLSTQFGFQTNLKKQFNPTGQSTCLNVRSDFRRTDFLALFYDTYQTPSLQLGNWPGFFNLNLVSQMRLILFVVHMTNRLAPHNLRVLRMPNKSFDLNASRLVHPIALDDTYQNSACHVPFAPVFIPVSMLLIFED
jgi:hypothetical protein